MKKNIDKFKTHEEAEHAFLTECCMEQCKPWYMWSDEMKNRYRLWLFEGFIPQSELNWVRDPSCSSTNKDLSTKTFSGTTVYWTNPPRKDDASLNNSAEDYDKIAKEVVDAWFEQHQGKPRLNKDRFDDYNSAWLCFEYECEYGDEKSADIYFSSWLFYPYNPSIIKAWKNGCKLFFRPRRHM